MFSVVNDEGKADIDIVSQDAINKNMNKVEIIRTLVTP
jgi:stage V sporulation protein SpoVS